MDNDSKYTYTDVLQLFKAGPILDILSKRFQTIARNQSVNSPKAAKFGVKTFEMYESSVGYMQRFIVYAGARNYVQKL